MISLAIGLSFQQGYAASPSASTLTAWDASVARSKANLDQEICDPSRFLSEVHRGGMASEQDTQVPRAWGKMTGVPSGLVHRWTGITFIPGVHIEDVKAVLQDYSSYADVYRPAVVSSELIARDRNVFRYRLKFVQKDFGIKTGLAADFRTTYYDLDDRRGYSITEAERLVELRNAGTSEEEEIPSAAARGYVEKVFTIVRYEESEGGVSVELETLTLSRDVPAPIRWLVAPLIERFSRQTIVSSLESLTEGVQRARTVESASRR